MKKAVKATDKKNKREVLKKEIECYESTIIDRVE